jgi:hypothetical protein
MLLLVVVFSASEAFAQVTITYNAVVISASGPHSAAFPIGEPVSVTYTLDPTVPDSNSDPIRGVFDHPVLALTVNFPGLAIFANAGPAGRAQTFDNVVAPSGVVSDQVFFFAGPISSASSLGGETISDIEVDFLEFVSPPSVPSMLTSDAIPTSSLPLTDSFVIFRTSSGTTFVHFAPPARDRIKLLIVDIFDLVRAGTLTEDQGDRLIRRLEAAIEKLDNGQVSGACNKLDAFIDVVSRLVDHGRLPADQGQILINTAQSIRAHLGC